MTDAISEISTEEATEDNGGSIYISNQWGIHNISSFIDAVNEDNTIDLLIEPTESKENPLSLKNKQYDENIIIAGKASNVTYHLMCEDI